MKAWKLLGVWALMASPLFGNTFTVTNTSDSGAGSLRQAILDANASPGTDTIDFDISGSVIHSIALTTGALPDITETVTIDGYTQPGSSPNTLANGDNAVLLIELDGSNPTLGNVSGLNLKADNCVVKGLVINRFIHNGIDISSNGNIIEGNFIGTDPTGTMPLANGSGGNGGITALFGAAGSNNTIGGTTASARNLISGNIGAGVLLGFSGNLVEGNFIGTDVTGTAVLGNSDRGVSVSGTGNTVGGNTVGAGNVISGNNRGVQFNGSAHFLQGNLIGTDVTGTVALPNLNEGVNLNASTGVTVGGTTTVPGIPPGNLISGNTGIGLDLFANSDANLVEGNIIGADISGTLPLGNSLDGISISGSTNTIGGLDLTAHNIIAFNGTTQGSGIVVSSSGTSINNSFLGNSIFSNSGLGIDLQKSPEDPNGITLNDPGDSDTGANNLQNYPMISSVTAGSVITINGSLDSTPNTTFRLEFFSNATETATGYGQGQTFIGSKDVTTDASGSVTYTANFTVASAVQSNFTATATDPNGNTSEFSASFGTELLNISTRMQVLTGDQVLIAGFIITGTGPKRILMRGIGPSLSMMNVPGALQDPTLELHDSVQTIQTNNNWQDTQEAEIEATGIPPTDQRESALIATLDPGAYTGILSGAGGTTGVGLVEVYDLDQTAGSRLANISTRGFVDVGDNVMIGGIIVGPDTLADATILFRAIGPSLGPLGVEDPLLDPVLELHDNQGTTIATNDDWKDTQQSEIEATGIPPTDERESALLETLSPGNYTAIVEGKNNTTGVALVEAYHIN